ncbi:TonB-dependent receptor plug domain-containing protein [Geoalkalibacter halelectricus]|uniref:TonB-dependent receptor plug domain-containing protein n=1 Tax=Geoalkalibacter halelectricus TaxID=2847045 RepID=UPI00266F648B|nr:TonB-dependent receptor [Geoalkalibacter halelectricus]
MHRFAFAALLIFLAFGSPAWSASKPLTDFSLEELMDVEVLSATKKLQPLSRTPAAVFVINAEDIRRSGATTIPDLLRMVPGLQVAKLDANKWAVSARGFNGRFANKLLVMIDGRSIYSPLLSGVFWEMHHPILEDIERIEVIRGPGGSLWGANAVNGIINIITRHSAQTQGTLVSAVAGTQEYAAATLSHGLKWGEQNHLRLHAQYIGHGESEAATHQPADDFYNLRTGLRLDRDLNIDTSLMVTGEVFQGKSGQTVVLPQISEPFSHQIDDNAEYSGGFLLARWKKQQLDGGEFRLQTYIDRTKYEDVIFDYRIHTYDVDFQHRFNYFNRHELTWGLGHRRTADRLNSTPLTTFVPSRLTYNLWSAFVQNHTTLVPDLLEITFGTKWEQSRTGTEWQPNLRLLYRPHPDHSLWAAVSRGVRQPSRAEMDVQFNLKFIPPEPGFTLPPFPIQVLVSGRSNLNAETLNAHEIGYRARWHENLFFDLAFFYNEYKHLIGGEAHDLIFIEDQDNPYYIQPAFSLGAVSARSHGVEVAGSWQAQPNWKLHLAYTYLRLDIRLPPSEQRVLIQFLDTEAPKHQISLRSSTNIAANYELDLWLRYVDALSNVAQDPSIEKISVSPYVTLDARLAWRHPRKNLELALVGQNLLNRRHAEFAGYDFFEVLTTEVPRRVYGKVTWRF